eukprot:TRINITY_DN3028_c0_g1_i1.p1 TRINITY_DN3028_c0_g1~~TRINITY_DN3028_c0_g1_i1.p1  ORF type:complete len:338 (+),score=13.48 TRINITY_DN3028_c0_g1_i1:233-1246(+)
MQLTDHSENPNMATTASQIDVKRNNPARVMPLKTIVESANALRVKDDDVAKSHINDYTSNDHLIGVSAYELVSMKTIDISYDAREKAGEEWLVISISATASQYISKYVQFLERRQLKFLQLVLNIIALLCSCGVNTWDAVVNGVGLNLVVLVFGVIHLAFSSQRLYYHLNIIGFHPYFSQYFAWVKAFYLGLLGLNSLTQMLNGEVVKSVACILLLYFNEISYSLLVTVCVVGVPFVILGILIELLIRLFACTLKCPHEQIKKRKHSYGVYKAGRLDAEKCVICLEEYKEGDGELVVLECKKRHMFHEKCILEWVARKNCCPMCRGVVKFCTSQSLV